MHQHDAAQQEVLTALVFPDAVPASRRFAITAEDRVSILRAMGQHPRESRHPRYDVKDYPDAYTEFLLFGGASKRIPASLRSFGKSGMAYGYLIDNVYVVDFERGIEFLLAAVVHVNANGIYNDDRYEYEAVGLPFLRDLGQAVYELEQERSDRPRPDLSQLRALFE